MSAAAAPSGNALTHAPSKATDAPTYASLSLVEDGGTTVLTALSSSAATASPAAMSTAIADAPLPPTTMPTATPMTLFVELNLIYYYYLFISITIIYLFTTTRHAVHRHHASWCRHRR